MTRLSDSPAPYGTPRKPGVSLDFVTTVDSSTELPPEICSAAMRSLASRARDAADARNLMEHLGLIDPRIPKATWKRANKPKGAAP